MTKTLKGQSARSFAALSNEEFINARGLFVTQPVRMDSGPLIQTVLASDTAVADDHSFELVVGKPDYLFDPCPVDIYTAKAWGIAHGNLVMAPNVAAAPSDIFDEPTLDVVVGGSVSGNIDFDGDTDNITVFLVSGQTYLISLRGTGATPINDSFLQMRDPSNAIIASVTDDDGGNDLYSISTYTAAATGNYTIIAATFANPGAPDLGGWTVDVRVQGADAVGDTNATSVVMGLGTTFGFRESGTVNQPPIDPLLTGDLDRYKVTLEAGHFYTFKVAGSADYTTNYNAPPTGTLDTFIYLTNTAGAILAANDDNSFPSDISSSFGYFAQTSGTYYLNVTAYSGQTGGYVVDFEDVDFANEDPLDALNWFSADNIDTVPDINGTPTAYVYFAVPGEGFGETADNGVDPIPSHGWSAYEKAAIMSALQEFSKILGINYVETTDVNQAEFRLITTTSAQYGAYFYPQDPSYGTQQGIGAFNIVNRGWNETGANPNPAVTTDGLQKGGFAYAVILHEFGHAHGLAHPHDHGGGSDIMLGVTGSGSVGLFSLNQQVYTQMSYNEGWQTHPDGALTAGGDPVGFRSDAGWGATLTAFDIATLQLRYGIINPNATGDTTYSLRDFNNEGNWYECIWDTGGTDTIEYTGATRNAVIDLTAATLDYSPTGGGVLSFVRTLPGETTAQAIKGGFTIANGVVIENATTGGGNDNLIGNSAANVLTGNGGNDNFVGRAGDDTLHGGAGTDVAYYDGNRADYTITAIISGGVVTGFTINDDNAAAPADSSNPILVADEGTDTLDGVETLDFADTTFSLVGNVLVYDASDNLVGVHATIQAAVNASNDNYTIVVGAGTYVEQVVVNDIDGLTIEAAAGALVTIQAPADVVQTGTKASGQGVEAVVTVLDSADVTIDNINVYGAGVGDSVTSGNDFVGVFYRNSSGSLLTVDVTAIRDAYGIGTTANGHPIVSGVQRGQGVLVSNDDGPHLSFTMTGGSISDFQKTGINVRNADLDISGVTFTGGGAQTVNAQNGIQVQLSTGTIDGNTVSGIGYAGTQDVYSGGMLLFANTDLFVTGNHVTGSNGESTNAKVVGIWILDFGIPNSGGEVTGNTLSHVDTGIDVSGDVTPTSIAINDNTVTNLDLTDPYANGVYFAPTPSFPVPHTVEGTDVQDYLAGGDEDDNLSGLGGDDELVGHAGSDHLRGGSGVDTMNGGGGNDFIFVDDAGDIVEEVTGEGYDNVISSVDYTLTAGADVEVLSTDNHTGTTFVHLIGNELDNIVIGNDGENWLDGGSGGTDRLAGRAGDDFLFVDTGDIIDEADGGGYDNVLARSDYALNFGQRVEVLSTTNHGGTDSIDLTGNDYANVVIGNAGDNVLDGSFDHDRLDGLSGSDSFAFTTNLSSFNWDTVVGFTSGDDHFLLDDAVFTGLTTVDSSSFTTGTAATTAAHRIIYDANSGALYFDQDGVGGIDQIQFALVETGPLIAATDFTVI